MSSYTNTIRLVMEPIDILLNRLRGLGFSREQAVRIIFVIDNVKYKAYSTPGNTFNDINDTVWNLWFMLHTLKIMNVKLIRIGNGDIINFVTRHAK